MNTIVVATDFSARSDRAIRRAVLLAHTFEAAVQLVHVVDDDQPVRIVTAEEEAADAILNEQSRSIRELDGLDCGYRIVLGDPFEGISHSAQELAADLVIIGPHRRQALKDMFIGTTAERTIRLSRLPILMANAVPAGPYRRALVATDLSEPSKTAVRAVADLGLFTRQTLSLLHVFDAPESWLRTRGSLSEDQIKAYLANEKGRAASDLSKFASDVGLRAAELILEPSKASAGHMINETADKVRADVIVVGTHSRSRLAKAFLGSVAEEVLRTATRDVLVVPPEVSG